MIVVHCSPDDLSTPLPPGEEMLPASVGGPAGASSEGWVVTRKIKDFELLHSKLKEVWYKEDTVIILLVVKGKYTGTEQFSFYVLF